jgi:hypothetical protein
VIHFDGVERRVEEALLHLPEHGERLGRRSGSEWRWAQEFIRQQVILHDQVARDP